MVKLLLSDVSRPLVICFVPAPRRVVPHPNETNLLCVRQPGMLLLVPLQHFLLVLLLLISHLLQEPELVDTILHFLPFLLQHLRQLWTRRRQVRQDAQVPAQTQYRLLLLPLLIGQLHRLNVFCWLLAIFLDEPVDGGGGVATTFLLNALKLALQVTNDGAHVLVDDVPFASHILLLSNACQKFLFQVLTLLPVLLKILCNLHLLLAELALMDLDQFLSVFSAEAAVGHTLQLLAHSILRLLLLLLLQQQLQLLYLFLCCCMTCDRRPNIVHLYFGFQVILSHPLLKRHVSWCVSCGACLVLSKLCHPHILPQAAS